MNLSTLAFLLSLHAAAQPTPLALSEAIRAAWRNQPGLQAGQAMADQARFEAQAAAALRRPTLQAQAGWNRTDEPMQAFGMKLDQARILPSDFDPARLNRPDAISGLGAGIAMSQPLYAGGRLDAARRGAASMADAQDALQAHRRQQAALAVVQAYFGAQAADGGVAAAMEARRSAGATEEFIAARVEQGLLLRSELARVRAWRAHTDAALAEARRHAQGARSALALLTGAVAPAAFATALDAPAEAPAPATSGRRSDLEAARLQANAAGESVKAARGALKPEVGLNLAWGAARERLSGSGATWTTASLGARWSFSFSDGKRIQAAQAMARAAEFQARWQTAQADRERGDADAALAAARARVEAAREALAAAEEARTLRQARHREGLLPLTDLLDAEAAVQGAQALRLAALLELRTAQALSDFAHGRPVEGVTE